jgi:hypothetical protein
MANPEDKKNQEIKATMSSMGDAFASLRPLSPEASEPHSTDRLAEPQHTNFGDFAEKLTYTGRVNPRQELDPQEAAVLPIGVILAALEMSDGCKRVVQIGKREATAEILDAFNQKQYVGNPDGEYVIYVENSSGGAKAIVLNGESMPTLIVPGQEIHFGTDGRHRVSGTVQKVIGFR